MKAFEDFVYRRLKEVLLNEIKERRDSERPESENRGNSTGLVQPSAAAPKNHVA